MSENLKLFFSKAFEGVIWKILTDPEKPGIFVEVRDPVLKRTSFSAYDFQEKKWSIEEMTMDEPWWISLQAVSGNRLFFTLYNDTQNPDKKSLVAYDVTKKAVLWWKNNFILTAVSGARLAGTDVKFGSREVVVDITDGSEIPGEKAVFSQEQNFKVIRPFQYQEGNPHFETVKAFLQLKSDISPTVSIEYCEYHSLILISAFTGPERLANYLFVFNSSGDLLLSETLGEDLKGIALDTFFIFSGYLIFVKNKRELVSYQLYD